MIFSEISFIATHRSKFILFFFRQKNFHLSKEEMTKNKTSDDIEHVNIQIFSLAENDTFAQNFERKKK